MDRVCGVTGIVGYRQVGQMVGGPETETKGPGIEKAKGWESCCGHFLLFLLF